MIYEFDNKGNLTRETWINGEDNRSTIQKTLNMNTTQKDKSQKIK